MKILNGADIASFIKERQGHQARSLIQGSGIKPKLGIVVCGDNPISEKYIYLKQKYGNDISIETEIFKIDQTKAIETINKLNNDDSIHGIIVQLPLPDTSQTDEIVNTIKPEKDVDSLSTNSKFDSATAVAILWLLSGYNIELNGKNIVILGHGRLVGDPLNKMMVASGLNPAVVDINTKNKDEFIDVAQIIISATGQPGILNVDNIPENAVVVDAGVASENGVLKGDVSEEVYIKRDDLKITPKIGGVGPLTVCALFENVIISANK